MAVAGVKYNRRISDPVARFWALVDKAGECWVWLGTGTRSGYGHFRRGRAAAGSVRAHRYSWEINCGPIPAQRFVLHKCDNPRCVRPDHLFIGTAKDNTADMIAKGRRRAPSTANHPRGENHGNARFTNEEVRYVRLAVERGISKAKLARLFNVRWDTIYAICARRTYASVN